MSDSMLYPLETNRAQEGNRDQITRATRTEPTAAYLALAPSNESSKESAEVEASCSSCMRSLCRLGLGSAGVHAALRQRAASRA